MIANNDVILALSWSGETAELKNITTTAPIWNQIGRDHRYCGQRLS
jgi:D-arabinose 5-phosphate isomerase GutQ